MNHNARHSLLLLTALTLLDTTPIRATSVGSNTGKTLLVRPLPAEGMDTVRHIALHASGRMAIVGELTQGLIAKGTVPPQLSYLSLYDGKGAVIQDFYTDLPGKTTLAGVTFDAPGNSYILGTATDLPGGIPGQEVFLKQFRPGGQAGWLKVLSRQQDGSSDDRAVAVATDATGNIYALLSSHARYVETEQTGPRTSEHRDAVLMKYSPEGQPLWTHPLVKPGADEASALSISPDGKVVVAVGTVDRGHPGSLYVLSSDGKLLAETELVGGEHISSLNSTQEGILAVGQRTVGNQQVAFLSRYSAQLEPQWTQFWAEGHSAYTAVTQAPNGDIYVAGRSDAGKDIYVLLRRYTADGQSRNSLALDSAGEDNVHHMVWSSAGQLWVGGSTYQAGGWSGWLSRLTPALDNVTPFTLQTITLEGLGNKAFPGQASRPAPLGMFTP